MVRKSIKAYCTATDSIREFPAAACGTRPANDNTTNFYRVSDGRGGFSFVAFSVPEKRAKKIKT